MKREEGYNNNRKVCFIAVITFIVIFLLPLASTYSNNNKKLSATRSIIPSESIKPGAEISVQIELKAFNVKGKRLILTEEIPKDWAFVKSSEAEMTFNAQGLNWTLNSENDDWDKTLFYILRAPNEDVADKYSISGNFKVDDPNDSGSKVKGVESISVDSADLIAWNAIKLITGLIVGIFLLILFFGWLDDHSLNKGEMRRAIAGTFIIGFSLLTILCIYYNISRSEVIMAYIELVGIVIGFYFGSRIAEKKQAAAEDRISIDKIKVDDDKKITLTVKNWGDKEIKVDKICLDDKPIDEKVKTIKSKESKEIEIDLLEKLEPDTVHQVRVTTSNGLSDEKSVKVPNKKSDETSVKVPNKVS